MPERVLREESKVQLNSVRSQTLWLSQQHLMCHSLVIRVSFSLWSETRNYCLQCNLPLSALPECNPTTNLGLETYTLTTEKVQRSRSSEGGLLDLHILWRIYSIVDAMGKLEYSKENLYYKCVTFTGPYISGH